MDLISKVIIITLATFLAALLGIQPTIVYEQVIPADYEQLKIDNTNLQNNLTASESREKNLTIALDQMANSRDGDIIYPRNWKSRDEIVEFLQSTNIDKSLYINKTYDCDDFALDLQQAALRWKDGVFLGIYVEKQSDGTLHMKNIAIAGNRIYTVEPQTDTVSYFCNVD